MPPPIQRQGSSFLIALDDLSADDERRLAKLIELVTGLLVVVAMQMSKTFPGWLYKAYAVVLVNAAFVALAAWANGRNHGAYHKGVKQGEFLASLWKQLTGKGTVYRQDFNPRLSLFLPTIAAIMQMYAIYVETNEPGIWEDWVAALSVAIAMSLPTILEICAEWTAHQYVRTMYFCAGAIAEADCGKDYKPERVVLVLKTEADGKKATLGFFDTEQQALSYWQAFSTNLDSADANDNKLYGLTMTKKDVPIGNLFRHTSRADKLTQPTRPLESIMIEESVEGLPAAAPAIGTKKPTKKSTKKPLGAAKDPNAKELV